MIFPWTWRIQSFRFHLRPIACMELPPAWTVRVGWCGDFARHRWGPPDFHFWYGILYDLFILKIIVRNEVYVSLFSRISLRLYVGNLMTNLTIVLDESFLVLLWRVSSSISFEPTYIILVDFSGQRESCPTDPRFRQWLIAINVPIIIDGRLLNYIKACCCLSLNINIIQRSRKIVLRNFEFRPWSNMISIYVVYRDTPENLSSFKIWTWISGFSFFCQRFFLKLLPKVASRSVHNDGWRLLCFQ